MCLYVCVLSLTYICIYIYLNLLLTLFLSLSLSKVLSYAVNSGIVTGGETIDQIKSRVTVIGDMLNMEDVDVICLQEVWNDGTHSLTLFYFYSLYHSLFIFFLYFLSFSLSFALSLSFSLSLYLSVSLIYIYIDLRKILTAALREKYPYIIIKSFFTGPLDKDSGKNKLKFFFNYY